VLAPDKKKASARKQEERAHRPAPDDDRLAGDEAAPVPAAAEPEATPAATGTPEPAALAAEPPA
jgi:hypothetical protein